MIINGSSDDSFAFIVCNNIGSGAFGKVLEAEYNSKSGNKFIVALKTFASKPGAKEDLEHEKIVLSSLQHNNIVQYWGSFTHKDRLYLILDLAVSSLASKIYERVSDHDAARILQQVAQGVIHCHRCGFIHRDIKPHNILLDHNNVVKLADFGLSKIGMKATTLCGTEGYVAPEMNGFTAYGREIDVWAIGVLLFKLLSGGLPFAYDEKGTDYSMISNDVKSMSQNAQDVIRRLLDYYPGKRIELEALDSLPFFRQISDH